MRPEDYTYFLDNIIIEDIASKKVLDIGSAYVNGSFKEIILRWIPEEYIGIDIVPDPYVDMVLPAELIDQEFEKDTFDFIICANVLEHTKYWEKIIHNMKMVCKPEGKILFIAPTIGFPYHEHPKDFWRYTKEDILALFQDCKILDCKQDKAMVYAIIQKPVNFKETPIIKYELYKVKPEIKIIIKQYLEKIAKKVLG